MDNGQGGRTDRKKFLNKMIKIRPYQKLILIEWDNGKALGQSLQVFFKYLLTANWLQIP